MSEHSLEDVIPPPDIEAKSTSFAVPVSLFNRLEAEVSAMTQANNGLRERLAAQSAETVEADAARGAEVHKLRQQVAKLENELAAARASMCEKDEARVLAEDALKRERKSAIEAVDAHRASVEKKLETIKSLGDELSKARSALVTQELARQAAETLIYQLRSLHSDAGFEETYSEVVNMVSALTERFESFDAIVRETIRWKMETQDKLERSERVIEASKKRVLELQEELAVKNVEIAKLRSSSVGSPVAAVETDTLQRPATVDAGIQAADVTFTSKDDVTTIQSLLSRLSAAQTKEESLLGARARVAEAETVRYRAVAAAAEAERAAKTEIVDLRRSLEEAKKDKASAVEEKLALLKERDQSRAEAVSALAAQKIAEASASEAQVRADVKSRAAQTGDDGRIRFAGDQQSTVTPTRVTPTITLHERPSTPPTISPPALPKRERKVTSSPPAGAPRPPAPSKPEPRRRRSLLFAPTAF